MGHNEITNLLEKLDEDKIPKFTTTKWIEMFDQPNGTYNQNKDIRLKTPEIRDGLIDLRDGYIAVTGKINGVSTNHPNYADIPANNNYTKK